MTRAPAVLVGNGQRIRLLAPRRPTIPVADPWRVVQALERADAELPATAHAWLAKRAGTIAPLPDGSTRVAWTGTDGRARTVRAPSLAEALIGAVRAEDDR